MKIIGVYDLKYYEQVRYIGTLKEVAKEFNLTARELDYILKTGAKENYEFKVMEG